MTKTLSVLHQEYLAYRRTTAAKSESTIKNDDLALRLLIRACGDIQPANITPQHVDKLVALLSDGKATATFNTRLAAVKTFLAWCRHRGYVRHNALALIPSRRNAKPDRHRVPVTQFPALLDAALHPRDRIVIAIGLWLFLRASEIRHLKIRDLDLETNDLHVYIQKTHDYDVMPVSSFLETELRKWLTFYTEDVQRSGIRCAHDGCGPLCEDWFLVPSKHSNAYCQDARGRIVVDPTRLGRLKPTCPMNRHAEKSVKAALHRIGHPTFQEGCHTLRRSGARAYFDQLVEDGYDGALKMVSAMLHHASVTMTEHYLGIREDRHRRNSQIKGRVFFAAIEAVPNNVTPLSRAVEG